jgi:carbonic anhydrase/acetyltransferase-like protein (isoleucine patch superfamily)
MAHQTSSRAIMQRIGHAWISPLAVVVGDVVMGEDCNVWPFSVLRGDVGPIRLGRRVNVQDGSVLHCETGVPLEIGDEVVIGHNAVVHCRRVGAHTLIGIKATALDGAQIGANCIIGAGAIVPPGMEVPDGHLVLGVPGRIIRPVRDEERGYVAGILATYEALAREHAAGKFTPFAQQLSSQ